MLYSMISFFYCGVSMRRELQVGRGKTAYSHILSLVCCLTFLLSGCATFISSSASKATVTPGYTRTKVAVTVSPTESAEAKLAQQQAAKVDEIMRGMSLEQRLG